MNNTINELFGAVVASIFALGWIGSIPLAFMYGDKVDVLLAFFIPYYGVALTLLN